VTILTRVLIYLDTTEEVTVSTDVSSSNGSASVDMKLEVVVIPVSDVDRAKEFYGGLGWRLDADFPFDNGFRVVQFTPPGSGCSVQFGTKMTTAEPGTAQSTYLIVSDIAAACDELKRRGVDVSEIFHGESGVYVGSDEPYLFGSRRVSGPDPAHGGLTSPGAPCDICVTRP